MGSGGMLTPGASGLFDATGGAGPLLMAPGHVGIALLAYAPVAYLLVRFGRDRRMWGGVLVLLAVVMWPDVDLYVAGLAHRGITHTVWTALLVGILVAGIAWGCTPLARARRYSVAVFGFQVGTLGIVAHLLGDVATPMGIRPLYPLYRESYTLDLVLANDVQANTGLLVAGVAAVWLALGYARIHGHIEVPAEPETAAGDR